MTITIICHSIHYQVVKFIIHVLRIQCSISFSSSFMSLEVWEAQTWQAYSIGEASQVTHIVAGEQKSYTTGKISCTVGQESCELLYILRRSEVTRTGSFLRKTPNYLYMSTCSRT